MEPTRGAGFERVGSPTIKAIWRPWRPGGCRLLQPREQGDDGFAAAGQAHFRSSNDEGSR